MKIFQIITDYTIQEKPHRFISPLNSSEKPSTMGKLASSQQSVNLPQFHSVILWHSFGFPGISISSEPVWVTSKKSISPSSRHDPSVKWHQVPLQMVWGRVTMNLGRVAGPSSGCPPFSRSGSLDWLESGMWLSDWDYPGDSAQASVLQSLHVPTYTDHVRIQQVPRLLLSQGHHNHLLVPWVSVSQTALIAALTLLSVTVTRLTSFLEMNDCHLALATPGSCHPHSWNDAGV